MKKTFLGRMAETIEDPNSGKISWHRVFGGIIILYVIISTLVGVKVPQEILKFFQDAVFYAIGGVAIAKAAHSIGKGLGDRKATPEPVPAKEVKHDPASKDKGDPVVDT